MRRLATHTSLLAVIPAGLSEAPRAVVSGEPGAIGILAVALTAIAVGMARRRFSGDRS